MASRQPPNAPFHVGSMRVTRDDTLHRRPVMLHASYLINRGQPLHYDPHNRASSEK